MRVSKVIKIEKIADLSAFVKCAEGASSDVICTRGRFVTDGRSLLGVFALNPVEPFTVEYDEIDIGLHNYIQQLEVKNAKF